jgi:hypothetical protein
VVDYFQNQFQEVSWVRLKLDGITFTHLENSQCVGLESSFLEEEVLVVVLNSDGNKSPGPDGFNFNFFKNFGGFSRRTSCFSLRNSMRGPDFPKVFPPILSL